MNLTDNHPKEKALSVFPLFKGQESSVTSLQILENGHLKEHLTKTPAMLVCVTGEVVFENEKGHNQTLSSGDYIQIEPMVKHWVNGVKDSQLLLFK